jgi:mono/diheme cytochrome c family protein
MNMIKMLILFLCLVLTFCVSYEEDALAESNKTAPEVKTDTDSVTEGRSLFVSQCSFCHSSDSTETLIGPGLSGILKRPLLPVSKEPATVENIKMRLKEPYRYMTSFVNLSNEEVNSIVVFLNTL